MGRVDVAKGKPGEADIVTGADKMPNCVKVALSWIVVFYVILQICLVFPEFTSPWTLRAFRLVLMAMMAFSCLMICLRKVIAVILPFLAIVSMFVMQEETVGLFITLLVPSLLIIMPSSLKWWQVTRRFAIMSAVLAVLSVSACWMFMITPSISSDDISNIDPMFEFSIGDKARHDLDKLRQHRYGWWWRGRYLGTCIVGYDQNQLCSLITLDMVPWEGDPKRQYAGFSREMKSRCENRFGRVAWKEVETDMGLPMWRGTAKDGTGIDIFSEDDSIVYGKVLIYRNAQ